MPIFDAPLHLQYKNGHYFVKRPALDYFMEVVGYPNFELVIYTSENMSNVRSPNHLANKMPSKMSIPGPSHPAN
jgi:hypothetical protein